ncbi:MAG: restriction endonuclease subunit S [Anaerobutyricum soehngenii]
MSREMKDSGVEWLGEIPKGWNVKKGKALYSITTGKLDANAEEPTGIYPFFTCSMFPKKINQYAFDCEALLVAGNGVVGFTQYYKGKFNAYQRTYVLSDFHNIYPLFLKYYVSNNLKREVEQSSVGSVIQFIKLGDLQNFNIAFPEYKEQEKITEYLEMKCQKIDHIIEKTKSSIVEYKKFKQSIITQAVTKGIVPERLMKECDINWIGKIPQDWKVQRGKNLFIEINERSTTGEEELLTVSHITGVTPRKNKNVNMFVSESLVDYKICHEGDIAANTMWMWQGAIGVSKYYGVISPSYNTYRQKSDTYDADYLEYLLRIPQLVATYAAHSTGITASRLRLYPQGFFSILFPVPPRKEQQEIAVYLNKKIPQIDQLIIKKEKFVDELKSYKRSLIYEYVTGKKEVPEF